jgi:serine/threonine protein kinase
MGWLGGEELTGRILGGCELRQYLGSGAMSTVFLGYQSSLDREVAVKVLPQSVASVSGYGARFSKEARILGLLEHPNIVPIYDYGTDAGVSYIIMRLMTGGSLAPRLSEKELSVNATLTLIHELADALDYAHNRGVVHRDIKASNVLFDQRGRGHLADFGIAKLLDTAETQTTPTNQFGTPAYMAPELWRDAEPSPAADIYALGILTYFALARVLPFDGSSPYALMVMHLTKRHTPLREHGSDIPEAVDDVISRAIDKDPHQRFASSGEFADALDAAFGTAKPSTRGRAKQHAKHKPVSVDLPADPVSAARSHDTLQHASLRLSGKVSSRNLLFVVPVLLFGIGLFAAIANRPSDGDAVSSATVASESDNATNIAAVNSGADDPPTPSMTSTLMPKPSTTLTASAVPTETPSATLPTTAAPTASATFTLTTAPSSTLTLTSTSTAMVTASETHPPSQDSAENAVGTQIRTANSNIPASNRSTGSLTAARQSIIISQSWIQGDIVDLCLRSRDFDAMLWLADAEGTDLALNDDHGGGIDACIMQYPIPATGKYLITVGSYNAGATGDYELVITSYGVCGPMPIAVINVLEANLRLEPNSTSRVIDGLDRDSCYAIQGRTSNGIWWQVTNPEGNSGWLSVATINIVGNTDRVTISVP